MEETVGPEPSNGKISPKTKVILITTIVLLAICVLVALFFNKPKQIAQAATPAIDITILEKAVAANPTTANILAVSARYIKINEPTRAFPYLKALIKREPGNSAAYCDLGVANIMIRNYKQGIEACTKAVQLNPNFQLAINDLQWGIAERNRVLKTIDDLNGREDAKKDNAYYTLLGLSYFHVGDYDKAIASWQTGAQKFPVSNTLYFNNIGSAEVIQKQYDAAIASFNRVLSIDPNNQLAKNNILWAKSDAAENHN